MRKKTPSLPEGTRRFRQLDANRVALILLQEGKAAIEEATASMWGMLDDHVALVYDLVGAGEKEVLEGVKRLLRQQTFISTEQAVEEIEKWASYE